MAEQLPLVIHRATTLNHDDPEWSRAVDYDVVEVGVTGEYKYSGVRR